MPFRTLGCVPELSSYCFVPGEIKRNTAPRPTGPGLRSADFIPRPQAASRRLPRSFATPARWKSRRTFWPRIHEARVELDDARHDRDDRRGRCCAAERGLGFHPRMGVQKSCWHRQTINAGQQRTRPSAVPGPLVEAAPSGSAPSRAAIRRPYNALAGRGERPGSAAAHAPTWGLGG